MKPRSAMAPPLPVWPRARRAARQRSASLWAPGSSAGPVAGPAAPTVTGQPAAWASSAASAWASGPGASEGVTRTTWSWWRPARPLRVCALRAAAASRRCRGPPRCGPRTRCAGGPGRRRGGGPGRSGCPGRRCARAGRRAARPVPGPPSRRPSGAAASGARSPRWPARTAAGRRPRGRPGRSARWSRGARAPRGPRRPRCR